MRWLATLSEKSPVRRRGLSLKKARAPRLRMRTPSGSARSMSLKKPASPDFWMRGVARKISVGVPVARISVTVSA